MNNDEILLLSIEAFLRRASLYHQPFMVKGSIITRQYIPNPAIRKVADLDFVYLEFIDEEQNAEPIFSDWLTQITETDKNDGVRFRSFNENKFWRCIDYAMNDDFPTVDTDLLCWVNKKESDLSLDVSFNLDIDFTPTALMYTPMRGKPFLLEYTCPLSLQISWKLHQCLVRPRLKDIFDLIHLFKHKTYTKSILEDVSFALKKECDRDEIDVRELLFFVNINAYYKYKNPNINLLDFFSDSKNKNRAAKEKEEMFRYQGFEHFTSKEHYPYENVDGLLEVFKLTLKEAGFTENYILSL